jgi:ABC-type phosphate transport system ATPase subunit
VVNLLLRLYDLQDGRILIDGQDIAGVTQESLRRQIGMVTQDTSLLHRSVRDNILYGRPDASDADMLRAAERAEAQDFIARLTDPKGRKGYDAHVGERGVKLSGGQRQRVAIARVMLKDAPILLLDEATSALDSEVEAAIQTSLYRLMEGKTVVAIAHRLSTIAAMDRLVVMEHGRIVEQGDHQSLLAAGGIYARLWAHQSGGFLGEEVDDAAAAPEAMSDRYRPFWAKRFGTRALPADEPRRDGRAGLGQLRRRHRHRRRLRRPPQLRHGGDRPHAGGAGLSRRHHRAAGLAERRALQGAGPAEPVLRRHRREHGFDDQPLHGRSQDPQRRRLHARAARAASGPTAPRWSTPSAARRPGPTCPSCIGGIEASLRRIAHYDYWQDKVRRSILVDSKADLLLYGNAERAIVEIAHRLAAARAGRDDHRRARHRLPAPQRRPQRRRLVRDRLHRGRPARPHRRAHQPLPDDREAAASQGQRLPRKTRAATEACSESVVAMPTSRKTGAVVMPPRERTVIRLPAYEQVKSDPVLYAHANRVLHLETNPGNARALVQRHGDRDRSTSGSTRRRSR